MRSQFTPIHASHLKTGYGPTIRSSTARSCSRPTNGPGTVFRKSTCRPTEGTCHTSQSRSPLYERSSGLRDSADRPHVLRAAFPVATYSAGHTLTEGDGDRLRRLLIRRDGRIEMYQHMELSKNRVIAEKNGMIAAMGRHARAAPERLFGRRGQPRRVLRCRGRKPRPDHASPARASLGQGVARLAADSSPGARIDGAINGESAGAYPR